MYEALLAYFGKRFSLDGTSEALIRSVFIPKQLQKGDLLYREGEIAKSEAFVAKGLLRRYVTDQKGKEHIVQFAPENWWVRDERGFSEHTPSEFLVDALEDAELLLIDRHGHEKLLEGIEGFGLSFQKALQKNIVAKEKRIIHALLSTAEERYHDFLLTYPSLVQRVPQHMLASYLGITAETLSRLRSRGGKK